MRIFAFSKGVVAATAVVKCRQAASAANTSQNGISSIFRNSDRVFPLGKTDLPIHSITVAF
jgi:hypothetical protein